MTKLALLASTLLVASACQQDTKNLERKVDEMNKKLDQLMRTGVGGAGAGAAAGQQRARPPEPDRAKTYAVDITGDPFDGPADAKVTLVKAYDYACGYCERVRGTMDELHKKYGNDLRVVYKQLVIHPKNAMAGALAFCAAAKQGKHKEMDAAIWDKGFKVRQLDMSDVDGGKCWDTQEGCKYVVGYAQELGLDVPKFKADMKACLPFVQKDIAELQKFGLSSTPAAFINGRFISGAVPVENFSALIDEELKKANERVQQGTPAAEYYQQWVIAKGLKALER